MGRKLLLILLGFICLHQIAIGQACTTLGQNPETAFPVCGTTVFHQTTVPICGVGQIIAPGCESLGSPYGDKNPFWYKFTCYQSGTLSFVITPLAANEDYDWELFDVTGLPPSSVYTNTSTIVTGNWSGTYGPTGASSGGVNFIQCSSVPSDNKPTFALSPALIAGHDYILLVSHFSDTQSGYDLSFGGGTAVITDPSEPHLAGARAACDGTVMYVKLNKKMKCNSVAPNGSDFTINTALTNIISATGIGCSAGFDTDSLMLTLNNPLPAGNYILTIHNGSDLNTILDNCDRQIPVGETEQVVVFPVFPTPMDSVTKPKCAPQTLELVFTKPIRCSSIAADGSNFTITGPYPVTVTGASGNCGPSGLTYKIIVQLAAPMQVKGNFQIRLISSIIDECGQSTPVGDFADFSVKDTVNADFNYLPIHFGCKSDTINYSHNGLNEVNSWLWTFDNMQTSTLQNVQRIYTAFGQKQTTLIVSNGVCSDTSQARIFLDNYFRALFESTPFVCPQDQGVFRDQSPGNIVGWEWDFGNGITSTMQFPPPQSYTPRTYKFDVPVRLIVTNNIGCKDTITKTILVIDNCYIAVASAFTPNGDGLNDYLYPLNAYKAKDLTFAVYNRFGQRLFYTHDWNGKWDGTFKGQGADPGTYVWFLTYTNMDTNQRVEQKGSSILIR